MRKLSKKCLKPRICIISVGSTPLNIRPPLASFARCARTVWQDKTSFSGEQHANCCSFADVCMRSGVLWCCILHTQRPELSIVAKRAKQTFGNKNLAFMRWMWMRYIYGLCILPFHSCYWMRCWTFIYIYIVPRHQFVPFVPCGWFVSSHFAEMTLFPVPGKIQQPTSNNDNREQQQQKKKHAVKEKRATKLRLSEWRRPHRAHANTHRHTFGDTTKAEKSGYKWFIVAKTANSHNFYILENKKEWLDCWSLYIAHENTFVYCLTNVSYSMLYTIMNYLECWPWGGPTHSAFPNGQNESKKGGLADREMASFIQIISAHTNAASTRQHHKCEDKTSRLCVSIGKPVKHFALHCTIHFNIWIYYRIYGETRQKKQ